MPDAGSIAGKGWRAEECRTTRTCCSQCRALALGFAVGLSSLIGATVQPGSNPLPDGIYKYAIIDSGKPSGTSTIRVSRSNGQIVIEEHSSPMEATESSQRNLDPTTFVTNSFSVNSDGKRFVTLDARRRDRNSGAARRHRKGTKTTTISAPSGATFISVLRSERCFLLCTCGSAPRRASPGGDRQLRV